SRRWLATAQQRTQAMGDRPSTPAYRLSEWLWTALGIFSFQTSTTTAFAKSLPKGSSRRWRATAHTSAPTPATAVRPPAPSYALLEWLWIVLGVFSFQRTTAFAKSLPMESSRRWRATAHKAPPAMADRPSTPSYRALREWLWMVLGIFSLQPATAFAKSLPTESSRQ